jgi:hypothetical protein
MQNLSHEQILENNYSLTCERRDNIVATASYGRGREFEAAMSYSEGHFNSHYHHLSTFAITGLRRRADVDIMYNISTTLMI